jgi:TPR repeat protein
MADQIILADAQKGCTAGDADACLILGRMYVTGTAASKDAAAAARTFKQSCDLGSGAGCHALGLMHEKGSGTKANASEAAHYYQLACKRGSDSACKSVKRLSAKGAAPAFRLPDIFGAKAPAS